MQRLATMAATTLRPGLEGINLPFNIYATITIEKRTIIVGDVHGCFDELEELLKSCLWQPDNDHLILVGDLMSKGPKPLEVLRFAQQANVWCIRGNHDDAALKAYFELCGLTKVERQQHELIKYYKYTIQFTKQDVAFLESLPYTIRLPHYNSLVVHAGLVPGVPLEEQEPRDMYKMRNVIEKIDEKNQFQASENETEGVPWVSKWMGPENVYFGHDAKRGLQCSPFATGLDTGCCYGKQLTAMILPEKKIISTPAKKMYAKPIDKNKSFPF